MDVPLPPVPLPRLALATDDVPWIDGAWASPIGYAMAWHDMAGARLASPGAQEEKRAADALLRALAPQDAAPLSLRQREAMGQLLAERGAFYTVHLASQVTAARLADTLSSGALLDHCGLDVAAQLLRRYLEARAQRHPEALVDDAVLRALLVTRVDKELLELVLMVVAKDTPDTASPGAPVPTSWLLMFCHQVILSVDAIRRQEGPEAAGPPMSRRVEMQTLLVCRFLLGLRVAGYEDILDMLTVEIESFCLSFPKLPLVLDVYKMLSSRK